VWIFLVLSFRRRSIISIESRPPVAPARKGCWLEGQLSSFRLHGLNLSVRCRITLLLRKSMLCLALFGTHGWMHDKTVSVAQRSLVLIKNLGFKILLRGSCHLRRKHCHPNYSFPTRNETSSPSLRRKKFSLWLEWLHVNKDILLLSWISPKIQLRIQIHPVCIIQLVNARLFQMRIEQ